jgi:hypothetical protein
MKRQQQSVLLAGVLAISQLTACSAIGWKGFGSSPMPPQAATAPAAASSGATSPASPAVTASAADHGNASGNEPSGKN